VNGVRLHLRERCVAALREYLDGGGETALHAGYEVGREALERGLGVLDLSAITYEALLDVLERDEWNAVVRTLNEAGPFLLECASPFEMAHRGAHDSNAALRRIVQVREEENRRLALELHDQASQMLAAVHLALDGVGAHLAPGGQDHLDTVRRHLRSVESQLRRISHEMRPPILDDLGLEPALRYLCDGFTQRSGVVVHVQAALGDRPPAAIEIALYRVAQEALNNVVRHARATVATLRVEQHGECVRLSVRDDGVGFDPHSKAAGGTHPGLGLRGVRERVAALGGELEIRSEPGQGTELRVSVPYVEVEHGAHSAGR
jgi:signal transduction histidine kinase